MHSRPNNGICNLCKKPGHYKANCPDRQQSGTSGSTKRTNQASDNQPVAKRAATGARPSWPPVGTGRPTEAANADEAREETAKRQKYKKYLAFVATEEDDEWEVGQGDDPEQFERGSEDDLD